MYQQLLERTRLRKERLNQKLGRSPEVTPRKRTLEENISQNTNGESHTTKDDTDSPGKRQCVREEELAVKADTPAIISVKSRLGKLQSQRQEWSSADGVDLDGNTPVPQTTAFKENYQPEPEQPSGRKGRFAKLAQNINNWEDDLSHPVIQKPVEQPKPKWQPPKKQENDSAQKPQEIKKSASPIKAYNPAKSVAPTPPPPPPVPLIGYNSPKSPSQVAATKWSPVKAVSTHTVVLKQPGTPKKEVPHHQIKQIIDQIPVNAKGLDESVMSEVSEEPTEKPVTQRMETWKQNTVVKKPTVDPSEAPLTSKLASWEQKISNTPNKATVTKVNMPTRQMATPVSDKPPVSKPKQESVKAIQETNQKNGTKNADVSFDPTSQSVATRMASWQQKVADAEPKREEEPTAYSILARMSAWEDMSSANKVSHIKKIDPGASPTASPCKPVQKPVSSVKNKPATPSKFPEVKPPGKSPNKNIPVINTPGKLQPGASPSVGSATKMMQQKLIEQTQHSKTDDLADKMRKERMAELQSLQNRWHNGVLKEDSAPSSQPQPKEKVTMPTSQEQKSNEEKISVANNRKEDYKERARADGGASYNFKNGNQGNTQKAVNQLPPRPPQPSSTTASKARSNSDPKPHQSPEKTQPRVQEAHSAPRPTSSIYRLISQKRGAEEKPQVP
ncbi:hypothetical protein KUTeg_018823 [Tegillarca granosa]|uniref:Anillin N-terminal domain-containing protein n=1 Tax=Tegillarca granosa TaxID=220873 RepID=A0ABQ9EFS9_TEGGR|nr:hypothetical protein KUTeg_018823 [Tegillarca granosa]